MITSRPLYDPRTGTHYLLDAKSFIFRISSDEVNKETRLKPHYAQIINLRYFQELTYKEIALEIGEPLNNVKVKILRARKLLAELIQK